ncbi:MAG: hypothetical protein QOI51_401 [Nocardioidaceae bacterium]|jgi:hypothetical protein|nr:hypothetical protein [Nocardioidaceae bacterium]
MSGQFPPPPDEGQPGQPPYGDQPPAGGQPPPYADQPPPYAGKTPAASQPPYGGQPAGGSVPPGGFPAYPSGAAGPMPDAKGFFGALFDFSFEHFITPIIVKVVYVVALVMLVIAWLIWTIVGFSSSAGLGILLFILGAVVVVLYLAFIRMTLEFYLAIVRMSQDIHRRLPG